MENHYKVHGKARLPGVYLWKPVRNAMVELMGCLMEPSFGGLDFPITIEKDNTKKYYD
jgi:hypothetical protein